MSGGLEATKRSETESSQRGAECVRKKGTDLRENHGRRKIPGGRREESKIRKISWGIYKGRSKTLLVKRQAPPPENHLDENHKVLVKENKRAKTLTQETPNCRGGAGLRILGRSRHRWKEGTQVL